MSDNYHLAKKTSKFNASFIKKGKERNAAQWRTSIGAWALLALALLFSTNIQADELMVHNGTATNAYVPVYGYYADAYLKSESVYPAAELSSMAGKNITQMTFYASQSSVSWGNADFQVFLREVGATTLSAFQGPGQVVYTGELSITGGTMTITFTTPYTYGGGNLLVGIYNTVTGSYVTSTWYGESVTSASVQGYSYSSLGAVSATQRDFLPKTTFTYENASSCPSPNSLSVSNITANSATINWNSVGGATSWDIYYSTSSTAPTSTTTPSVNGTSTRPYTITGLTAGTTYYVWVRSECGSEESSWSIVAVFSTLCSRYCEITYDLEDSYGDGWNGASIRVTDVATGELLATWTFTAGSSLSGTLAVCEGRAIRFSGVSGSYDSECSYTVYDPDNNSIFSGSGSGSMSNSATYTPSCPPPVACDDVIIMGNMGKVIECGATYCFYDSGGESSGYQNSEDYTAKFIAAGDITLAFQSFTTESASWDYIWVYDGTAESGTALISGAGGSTVTSPVTAHSGIMTVVWHSDGSNTYAGWKATITGPECCTPARTLSITDCPTGSVGFGSTFTLHAEASAGGGTVTWMSSDESIATVNASGEVECVGMGAVSIIATISASGAYCKAIASCEIAVGCTEASWNIDDINGQTKTIECGKSYCFYDSGGPNGVYSSGENYSCSFTSSGIVHVKFLDFYTESSTLDYFVITGSDNDGQYGNQQLQDVELVTTEGGTINFVWKSDGSVQYRGWKAIVYADGCCTHRSGEAGFTFCRDQLNLAIDGTLVMPVDGADGVTPTGTVTYTSSNPSVATVDADGTVHGIAAGYATITATIAAATVSGEDYCSVKASYMVKVGSPTSGTLSCVEIGNQESTMSRPLPGLWGWQYDVMIYRPSDDEELNSSCDITSIAFNATSAVSGGQLTIWVKDVDADYALQQATTFDDFISGASEVYSTTSFSNTTGWNTFNFGTPYPHTGGKALIVATRGVGCSTSGGCSRDCYYTTVTNSRWTKYADGTDPGTSSAGDGVNSSRPDIKICLECSFEPDLQPSVTLTGVPTEPICAGTAMEIEVSVENGTLDVSALNAALPSGLTYSTSTHKITGSISGVGTYEFDVTAKTDDSCLKDTEHVTIVTKQIDADISFPEP